MKDGMIHVPARNREPVETSQVIRVSKEERRRDAK